MKRVNYRTTNLVLILALLVFTGFISIGYAALNADLMISGDLDYVADNDNTLYGVVRREVKALDSDIAFSAAPTEATSGVYVLNSTKEDKYPVYFYRGIVSDNNVKFADFCWKMVRTTGTGGVKLIYNGEPADDGSCNNTGDASHIGMVAYNTSYDDAKYVGYTYDDNTDSNIKKTIDEWYEQNLIDYTGMIEDTIWCNDRSICATSGGNIYYGANGRLYNPPYKGIVTCPNMEHGYTVSTSNGNGKLKYPVALLTADEITLAGNGTYRGGYSELSYLYTGNTWWTLSPSNFFSGSSAVFGANSSGNLNDCRVDDSYGIRPSVSLASGIIVKEGGDGSVSNPYTVVEKKREVLYKLIANSSKSLDTNIDFGVDPTEETSGVYELNSTSSDTYPVYYYRGIVGNNNIKFANFCWKIVRTTSTGGVKLIYNGVPASDGSCNNTGIASQIGTSFFNPDYIEVKYVGYTYDANTDSTIKTYIDDWYLKNMTSYTGLLEDTEWCNDKSVYKVDGKFPEDDPEGLSTGTAVKYYGAYGRIVDNHKPSIVCPNASDKYTVSSSKGNGKLTYPVALLTIDEVTLKGVHFDNLWWTMSPLSFSEYYGAAGFTSKSYIVDLSIFFDYLVSGHKFGVRPSVSLAPGITIIGGNGSVNSPYIIFTN